MTVSPAGWDCAAPVLSCVLTGALWLGGVGAVDPTSPVAHADSETAQARAAKDKDIVEIFTPPSLPHAVAAPLRLARLEGMVNLTRIYTKTGDAGQTRLSDNSVAAKTDPRVEAYGHVDEANSIIGLALALGTLDESVAAPLRLIQNELFDVGADLSTPLVSDPEWEPLRIVPASVERLEKWCDDLGADLPNLRSFILPGGNQAGAQLHVARTVVRRAERAAWAAVEVYGTDMGTRAQPGGVSLEAIKYLNRLSDLLFIMSRAVNGADGDILWKPGTDRENPNK